MKSWIDDVDYYILPSQSAPKGYETLYDQSYECWRYAWEKFRNEVGINEKLHCDALRATDEIGTIFYKGECVGIHGFTFGSWERGMYKDLAYFHGWTDIALQKLKKYSLKNSLICSQFTINPIFSGKQQIVRWKEINFLYILLRYQHSEADIMCGHLNMTRKVQDAAGEGFGATILDPFVSFDYYGVRLDSQLVAYEKERLELIKDEKKINQLCEDLWKRMKNLSRFPVIEYAKSNKRAA
jgi:hypothetical protein